MNMHCDLRGQKAIVTGTSGHLGPIWVDILRAAGAEVYGIDITEGDDVRTVRIPEHHLPPDIVVNNAAIDNPPGSGARFFGAHEEIVAVNLGGAIHICEEVIPSMIKNGGGVIVNIGSILGNVGADWRNYEGEFEKPVGYNVSKAGLIQLARSIATQYGRYNIRCVTISFGPVETGKFPEPFRSRIMNNLPLMRFISRESLECALLFAIRCPELTGQQVLIDSGYTSF